MRTRTAVALAALALTGCGSATKTVTVTRVAIRQSEIREACLALQGDARRLADAVLAATEHMSDYQPLIARAAESATAGDEQAARQIVAKEAKIGDTITRGTRTVRTIVAETNADAKECRGSP